VLGVARQSLHDVGLGVLVGQRDGGHHVGAEVDAEDRDGAERQRDAGCDEDEERRDLGDVRRQRVCDRLLQVVEYQPTCTIVSASIVSFISTTTDHTARAGFTPCGPPAVLFPF